VKVRCNLSHFSACRSQPSQHLFSSGVTILFKSGEYGYASDSREQVAHLSPCPFSCRISVFGKTISLWVVKKFRLRAGIDTKIFSAHLAGSEASPLAVASGLSISSGVTI
jgi:hypothetical protein